MKLKKIALDLLPPVITRLLTQFLYGRVESIQFTGHYSTWTEACEYSGGYDAEDICSKVLEATLKVKRGEAAFERDSVLFEQIEYSWPLLSGLLLAGALNNGHLNVLDFGGSLGSTFFQNRRFLSQLQSVRWGVVEQSHFVLAGNNCVADSTLYFFDSIEACVVEEKPNVIVLSSVLQYLEDPWGVLDNLLRLNADVLVIDRTPFLKNDSNERISIQTVPSCIYKASYPCRHFIEADVVDFIISRGYILTESFEALDNLDTSLEYKGFVFNYINKEESL